jgi:hypothetical protein
LAKLSPSETSVIGQWLAAPGKVTGDEACQRIHELVTTHLIQVARSPDGWSSLYRDPSDGRLWEHSYPQSSLHGGGPPALVLVTQEQALARYGVGA